ncbi:MAG: hypothetical protein PVI30_21385 [Myxococcales bacterium]
MSPRALWLLLSTFAAVLSLSCLLMREAIALDPGATPEDTRIVSQWRGGERVRRSVLREAGAPLPSACEGCSRVVERIVDRAPLLFHDPLLLSISVVAGRDGLAAHLGERSVYLTPTDLLAAGASTGVKRFGILRLRIGFDRGGRVLDLAARELGVSRKRLLQQGRLERFLVRREDPGGVTWPRELGPRDVTPARLAESIGAAARQLAATVREDGRYVYQIDVRTGRPGNGYSWPRHAGATYFLAEAAHFTGDSDVAAAARRAARHLRERATRRCGEHRCIGRGRHVDVGSSALALLAYVELVRHGLDPSLSPEVEALAAFLRSMQRPDGELMHRYDRKRRRPQDVQLPYYTGEAAFALARAHRITGDARDLQAARDALAYLVRESWSFFGSRYFFGAEHWTCQALEELWQRAPDPVALRFCLDYHAFNRHVQFQPENPLGPYDGGYGPNPFFPPRLTSASSRSEAAVATLATAAAAGEPPGEVRALERQVRRSLAFIMRYQLMPGPTWLMADPARVRGGVPGSPVDLTVRNDFTQHAGSAMLRFARYLQGSSS